MLNASRVRVYTHGACWMFAEQAAAILERPIVALGYSDEDGASPSERWWGHFAVLLEDGSVFDARGVMSKEDCAADFLNSHASWFEVTDFEASTRGCERTEVGTQVEADVRRVLASL